MKTTELFTGTLIEFQQLPAITQEHLRTYAEASGDFNPIHLDDVVAKKVGLPGVIAHGMLIAGWITQRALFFVEREFSLTGLSLVRFQTRFKSKALLGDTPSLGGIVKEVTEKSIWLEIHAKNQRGETLTSATVQFKRDSG